SNTCKTRSKTTVGSQTFHWKYLHQYPTHHRSEMRTHDHLHPSPSAHRLKTRVIRSALTIETLRIVVESEIQTIFHCRSTHLIYEVVHSHTYCTLLHVTISIKHSRG